MSKKTPAQIGGKKHYDDMDIEPLQVIESMGESMLEGFCIGNAIKYTMRHKSKNGIEDLKKAEWFTKYWTDYLERKGKQK